MCQILIAGLFAIASSGSTESNPLFLLGTPGAQRQVTSLELWEEKRAATRAILDDFLGPFPDKPCPLQATEEAEEDLGTYRRLKVSYNTLPTERVPAYLLVPSGSKEPMPAMVVLHQTVPQGKDEVVGISGREEMAIARHLVERGYVVLAPDSIAAGERVGQGLQPYDTAEIYPKYPDWNALGIMVWESMRAVDFLCTRSECDQKRIGAIGHSHGGYGSIYLGAYDERIRCVVSSCGMLPIRDDPNPYRWSRLEWFIFVPRLRPYFTNGCIPFDFDEIMALIAPRPLLNCSAYNDEVFPNSQSVVPCMKRVEEVYEKIYNAGDRVKNIMHNTGHGFPDDVREQAYEWLARNLKQPVAK
ncbi:MAG: dienelactone hydrolase family protein [bacterium]